jgi:hypothetical protein
MGDCGKELASRGRAGTTGFGEAEVAGRVLRDSDVVGALAVAFGARALVVGVRALVVDAYVDAGKQGGVAVWVEGPRCRNRAEGDGPGCPPMSSAVPSGSLARSMAA